MNKTTPGSQFQFTPSVVVEQKKGPGCFIQAIWFILIGWWLGALAILAAWFLNLIIIGLPLGMSILNKIPKILALQEPTTKVKVVTIRGRTVVTEVKTSQTNFIIRAIYFVFIGSWWSLLWLSIAYVLCGTILLMPVGLKMFQMAPAMTTLKRY